MKELNKTIRKHNRNNKKLKELYMGNSKLSYEKGLELQKQQKEEEKRLLFFMKLREELYKK